MTNPWMNQPDIDPFEETTMTDRDDDFEEFWACDHVMSDGPCDRCGRGATGGRVFVCAVCEHSCRRHPDAAVRPATPTDREAQVAADSPRTGPVAANSPSRVSVDGSGDSEASGGHLTTDDPDRTCPFTDRLGRRCHRVNGHHRYSPEHWTLIAIGDDE